MSTLKVEQECRELLIAALNDGVFDDLDTLVFSREGGVAEEHFSNLTPQELTGMCGKLHEILRRYLFQK